MQFISCASEDSGSDDIVTSDTAAADTKELEADPGDSDDLPNLDFAEKEIKILYRGKTGVDDEYKTHDISGDLINDAVLDRNRAVEDTLNIKLTFEDGGSGDSDVSNKLHKAVTIGDADYPIAVAPSYIAVQNVLKGDYTNLKNLKYVDLGKNYWSQGYNEMASWDTDKQYLTSGAPSISLYRYMYITLYYKTMLSSKGIKDPYEAAINKQWTIEYQYDLIKDVYDDVNGQGDMDENDVYGLVSGSYTSSDAYWVGGDAHVISRDEDNHFAYKADIARLEDLMSKVMNLYYNKSTYIFKGGDDGMDGQKIIKMFAADKALMSTVMIDKIENGLRNYEGNYGILPMPKYDEYQKNYRTCVQDQLSSIGISAALTEKRTRLALCLNVSEARVLNML